MRNRYKNTSKKGKEKLKEHGKIYRKAKKQCYKKVRYFFITNNIKNELRSFIIWQY